MEYETVRILLWIWWIYIQTSIFGVDYLDLDFIGNKKDFNYDLVN